MALIGTRLLVIGGVLGRVPSPSAAPHLSNPSNITNELWAFDISIGVWSLSAAANAPPALAGCTATTVGAGMYVIGGRTLRTQYSRLVYLYHPQTDMWTTLTPRGAGNVQVWLCVCVCCYACLCLWYICSFFSSLAIQLSIMPRANPSTSTAASCRCHYGPATRTAPARHAISTIAARPYRLDVGVQRTR